MSRMVGNAIEPAPPLTRVAQALGSPPELAPMLARAERASIDRVRDRLSVREIKDEKTIPRMFAGISRQGAHASDRRLRARGPMAARDRPPLRASQRFRGDDASSFEHGADPTARMTTRLRRSIGSIVRRNPSIAMPFAAAPPNLEVRDIARPAHACG